MSPISMKTSIRGLLAALALFSLAACGDTRSETNNFSVEAKKHPANWVLSQHKQEALANLEGCFECHGTEGNGGISNIACNSCHLGGPLNVHPEEWGVGGVNVTNNHGEYLGTHTGTTCSTVYCHGVNWEGSSGPACAACHY